MLKKNKNLLSFILNWLWLFLNAYKNLELTVTSSYKFRTFFVQLENDSSRKEFSDMLIYEACSKRIGPSVGKNTTNYLDV